MANNNATETLKQYIALMDTKEPIEVDQMTLMFATQLFLNRFAIKQDKLVNELIAAMCKRSQTEGFINLPKFNCLMDQLTELFQVR